MRALSLVREENSLKAVVATKKKGIVAIEHLQTLSLEDPHVKPLYILEKALKGPLDLITTPLESTEILFRQLSLPIRSRRKALQALPFQTEELIPYPLEEALFAPIFKKETLQSVFAVRDSSLKDFLNSWEPLGIDPDVVDSTPLCLYRFFQWLYPARDHGNLFYGGREKSFCVSVAQGQICFVHTLHIGERTPEEEKNKELERFAIYWRGKQLQEANVPWLCFGEGSLEKQWEEMVGPVERLPQEEIRAYALAVGGAVNALSRDAYAVNFRQGKWESEGLKRKRKGWIRTYAFSALALTIVVAVGGSLLLREKKGEIAHALMANIPHQETPSSIEELSIKLFEWEKSLNSQKLSFPFVPNLPTVTDLLAWLSSHPLLTGAEGGKKEEIEVRSLRYQLYQYPKLGEKGGAYQGKVELELVSSSARLAREFHDALLKGDRIVNGKKEIKWSNQQNSYLIAFELNHLNKGGTP